MTRDELARNRKAAAISWAEGVWGREVRDAHQLSGGWTSTMLSLQADDGQCAVLRVMTREPWRSHAAGLLARESETQRQLLDTKIAAPMSLGVDPDGTLAGSPAHLMSWLPGAVELTRADPRFLQRLARLLTDIHRHDPGSARPRTYQSWAPPAKRVAPAWSQSPTLWEQAFEVLARPAPPYQGTFLHRDFHLGNVLWQGEEVTGVVDWVETSWGPAGLDVAHCTTYLAMLHGPETAEVFVSAYRDLADGFQDDPGVQPYWQVMDIVGYLPDPTKVVQPWRELGRQVSDRLARTRLEQHLAAVLQH